VPFFIARRPTQEELNMGEHDHRCCKCGYDPCASACDPLSARAVDQSITRYNDQTGNQLLAAQQAFLTEQQAVTARLLDQMHNHQFVNSQMQLRSIGAFRDA
jgi:hypothetical protein